MAFYGPIITPSAPPTPAGLHAGLTLALRADAERLKAIRGAGGAFGIVTEITIPVHPVGQILAGVIMYDSTDRLHTMQEYNTNYQALCAQGIPAALTLHQSPLPTSRPATNGSTQSPRSPRPSSTGSTKPPPSDGSPPTTRGRIWTINLKELTSEVLQVITNHTTASSRRGTVISCSKFWGAVGDEEQIPETMEWGSAFQAALRGTNRANVLDAPYLSLSAQEELDMERGFRAGVGVVEGVEAEAGSGGEVSGGAIVQFDEQ
ncbi:hypothetical protein BO71DRAFT_434671 [Aspergillus ellipticus CBS 707.79]|uniref:Uncharacterized protein n=1 Tax=Aspergillus ellipticus CBS 707.79 TaxID=1448320 RepID=A0A319DNB7_9EURO|nr:hypothetical protein BO71DRAFT_434671 [Aspergillus ellipticus CBS 707.79]